MLSFDYDEELVRALRRVYGEDLERVLDAIARPPSRFYVRVNTLKIDPGELFDELRSRGVEVYRDEELEEALYFPIRGPFKIEEHELRVVADKKASESVYMGADLYAPGVESCDERIERGDEVTVYSPTGVPIAEGVAEMSCREALEKRRGLFVKVVRSRYLAPKVRNLPEYERGLIYSQSLAAMYVARALDPKPGSLIVDMCAAPGGKTGHVVELTKGRAHVIAFDHSRSKIEELRSELGRLGHLPFVEVWRADSRYLDVDYPWIQADYVVLDPPCSALGVRPKLFDKKSFRDVVSAAEYQWQFLKVAARILKVGGVLVYSTCTLTVEENEALIERLVSKYRCLKVVDTGIERGSRGVYGRYADLYTRFHPHEHDTTGYFIAKIVRVC